MIEQDVQIPRKQRFRIIDHKIIFCSLSNQKYCQLGNIPRPSIVYPAEWPPGRGTRAIDTYARALDNNRISVTARCGQVTVWLSPRIIDFERPGGVRVNGDEIRAEIAPDLGLMLEDVRRRGDRKNPFWAKVEWPERRR